jgi:hypothetical protein
LGGDEVLGPQYANVDCWVTSFLSPDVERLCQRGYRETELLKALQGARPWLVFLELSALPLQL